MYLVCSGRTFAILWTSLFFLHSLIGIFSLSLVWLQRISALFVYTTRWPGAPNSAETHLKPCPRWKYLPFLVTLCLIKDRDHVKPEVFWTCIWTMCYLALCYPSKVQGPNLSINGNDSKPFITENFAFVSNFEF